MSKQNNRTELISSRNMNCGSNKQYMIVNWIASLTPSKVGLFQARCEYSCCLSSLLAAIRKFRGRDVFRERSITTRSEERRLHSQVRLFHLCSNIWIRLLFISHTTIVPSPRFAVATGFLNSPLPLPLLPNFVTNFPLSSNNWTLWLLD